MPVAQTIADSITDRLNRLSEKQGLSPFEVSSLRRDIDHLRQVDARQAYMHGGMLASLLGDFSESAELHEKSLRLGPGVIEYINYAVSMQRLNRTPKSLELFLEAFRVEPSLSVLNYCVKSMNFAGDYREFESVIAHAARCYGAADVEKDSQVIFARRLFSDLDALALPYEKYMIAFRHVGEVAREVGLHLLEVRQRVGAFDGVPHIYVEVGCFPVSVESLTLAADKLVDALLKDDDLEECWDKLIINFTGILEIDVSHLVA